jgi:protein tyrosine phosphatase
MEAVICGKTETPVHNLRSYIAKMSQSNPETNQNGFEDHFRVLQATGPQVDKISCRAGLQPMVQMKNRFKDIVPFDHSRVILKTLDESSDSNYANTSVGSDYINASFLNGYRRRNAFIVTQSPLRQTLNDFWKMIWEQDSASIVMLTPLEEEGEVPCQQYWPTSESAQYGSIVVEMKNETQRTDYVMRRMMVSKSGESRMFTQFQYTAWPKNSSPHSTASILDMVNQLQKWQQATGDKVITVHCNNGIGRSGAFCCLLVLIEILKMETALDIFHKVKALRTQRPGMVQTLDQYVFLHEIILAYLDSFQTYSNFE